MEKSKKYLKTIGLYYLSIGLFLFLGTHAASGQSMLQTADSLIALLPQSSEEYARIDLLNKISYAHRRISPQEVLKYARLAHQEASGVAYPKGIAMAHKNMGIAHYKMASDSSVYHYQKAIDLAISIEDYRTQAACNNNIALVFRNKGYFNTALRYYLQALEIVDTHFEEGEKLQALILTNTSTVYYYLGEYEKALHHMERGFEIGEKYNYPFVLSLAYDGYGRMLIELGQLDKAAAVLAEGLEKTKELEDFPSQISILNVQADLALRNNQHSVAKNLAFESYQLAVARNVHSGKLSSQLSLAKVARKNKEYDRAIRYSQQVIKLSGNVFQINTQQETRLFLADLLKNRGDHEKAYQYLIDYYSTKEHIIEQEKADLSLELEAHYQAKKQEQAIALLQKEKEFQNQNIFMLKLFSTLAFLAFLVILYLLYKGNVANRIINEKNVKLKDYINYNLQLENFAYIASHDLKTPLRTITSFTQLLQSSAPNKLNTEEQEYLKFILSGTKEMNQLINGLQDYSTLQKSKLSVEKINLSSLINQVLTKHETLIKKKKAKININLQIASLTGDRIKLAHLFHQLIHNALKFHTVESAPIIDISAQSNYGKKTFCIKDNGIGIAPNYFDKIFLIFKRLNHKETYPGIGIGLALCKKIVDLHGGKIWVESPSQKGTHFYFTLEC